MPTENILSCKQLYRQHQAEIWFETIKISRIKRSEHYHSIHTLPFQKYFPVKLDILENQVPVLFNHQYLEKEIKENEEIGMLVDMQRKKGAPKKKCLVQMSRPTSISYDVNIS